jgi:ATP-dependent DNA helicase PIF1
MENENSLEFKLNEKQKEAFEIINSGQSIFLTGPAGVGKSEIIKLFYRLKKDCNQKIALTSTTGVSAVLIGGTTLHSYLGIGLGTNSTDKLVKKIENSTFYKNRWLKLETLIIDEISMMSPELFDKLESMARLIRKDKKVLFNTKNNPGNKPFGGIQLILSGDALQLPVVNNHRLFFEAESWDRCIQKVVYLDQIIRQNDLIFQKCLNEVRMAKLSDETIDILSNCDKNDLSNEFGIRPTCIYPINVTVDKVNTKELSKLEGELREYEMEIKIHNIRYLDRVAKYKKSIKAVEKLTLAKDAQVMLLANLDVEDGLANGSRGIVIDFVEDIPIVRFMNGREKLIDFHAWDIEELDEKVATIYQIPLKLAYACTVHSSQGLSLDCVEINMKNFFEYGQVYVALSRVRSLKGLKLKNFDEKLIKVHPTAFKFYSNLEKYTDKNHKYSKNNCEDS